MGTDTGDSRRYLALAQNLALGNGYSAAPVPPFGPEVFRTPLYPAFVALFVGSGLGTTGLLLAQVLLYLVAIRLLCRLGDRFGWDPLAPTIFTAAMVLHAPLIRWSASIATEALCLPLVAVVVLMLDKHIRRPDAKSAIGLGLGIAALPLTRPEYLMMSGAALLVMLASLGRRALRVPSLIAALLFCCAIGAWAGRNLALLPGHFRPMGLGSGMALFVRAAELETTDHQALETRVLEDKRIRTLHDSSDLQEQAEADALLAREGLEVLATRWPDWLAGAAYRLGFRNWVELRDPAVPWPVSLIPTALSSLLLVAGYFGIWALPAPWARKGPPLLLALAVVCVHALLITEARYTAPIRPLLYLFSAHAIACAISHLRSLMRRGTE